MRWVNGMELSPRVREHALRKFVHRATIENFRERPEIRARLLRGGYCLRVLSDAEWLANTEFAVTQSGNLDARTRHCMSHHPDYPQRQPD